MDKLEYWFLDSAFYMRIGFSWVVPSGQYGLAINRLPLPLTVPEIGKVLERLFQKGDLLAITPLDENNYHFHKAFVPTYAQILAALEEKSNLSYFLTPQGGKRWESVAKPNWEEWTTGFGFHEPPDICELISPDRQYLERCVQLNHLIYGQTGGGDNISAYIIPGTVVWDKVAPWKPTYWKTFPSAYRVRYQIERVAAINEEEQNQRARELAEWSPRDKYPFRIDYFRLSTTLNLAEYLILDYAIKDKTTLQNVVFQGRLSQAEVLRAAHGLFEKGDILAQFRTEKRWVKDVSLSKSLIQAHLDGKFDVWYYVTPQGGANWEAVTHANWSQYYQWRDLSHDNPTTLELTTAEIISPDRTLIEWFLLRAEHVNGEILVPGTEVWEEVKSWQATYWKTWPKAYKFRYQYQQSQQKLKSYTGQEWKEAGQKKIREIEKTHQWYAEPEFEETEPQIPTSYPTPKEINLERIEYLILRKAIIYDCLELRVNDYSTGSNYEELSHREIAIGADSLFQKGYIRARVFIDGWADSWLQQQHIKRRVFAEELDSVRFDFKGTPDVVLNMAGIRDHLDGTLRAQYYLTPEGGAHWETIAHPDWNKFLVDNFHLMFPYEQGIFGTQRENIEKLLAHGNYLLRGRQPIPGTEVWEVLEPWQVTYWKTLPRGYHVHYQYDKSDGQLNNNISTEIKEQGRKWYKDIQKWYQDPEIPPFLRN